MVLIYSTSMDIHNHFQSHKASSKVKNSSTGAWSRAGGPGKKKPNFKRWPQRGNSAERGRDAGGDRLPAPPPSDRCSQHGPHV